MSMTVQKDSPGKVTGYFMVTDALSRSISDGAAYFEIAVMFM